MDDFKLIVSCEHGGNAIPKPYRHLFKAHHALLASHRGVDIGALDYARRMAARFNGSLFTANISRLLVDLNRSPGHPALFSAVTRALPADERQLILGRYHRPHRQRVTEAVRAAITSGHTAIHIACHTFAPVLEGRLRTMDVGLLYDPCRREERCFCDRWKQALRRADRACRVRRNAPYKGVSDGLATFLRTLFPQHYLGIEVELNQCHLSAGKAQWRRLCAAVLDSLDTVLISISE